MNIKYILYYCITKTHAEAMYAYGRIFEISATQCNPMQPNATQNNATQNNATQNNATNTIPRLCE